jgi:hypothetical protein
MWVPHWVTDGSVLIKPCLPEDNWLLDQGIDSILVPHSEEREKSGETFEPPHGWGVRFPQ